MATLDLTYDELRRQVGRYLGYDRTPSNWATPVPTDVDDILRSGLRMFYHPSSGHIWSFLKRVETLNAIASTRQYDLPADFAAIVSPFSFAPNVKRFTIEGVDESVIRSQYANSELNGSPYYYAVRAKPVGDGSRTQHEALLYPVPDQTYKLTYRYLIEPTALSVSNIYPLGGAVHGETILEACLFAAEKTLNPEAIAERGGPVHGPLFEKHLAGSIALDTAVEESDEASSWPAGTQVYGSYEWLRREVGRYMDFGADHARWTREQAGVVDSCIQSGLQWFYIPPLLSDGVQHEWSFLRLVTTQTLSSGDYDYDLPLDFGTAPEHITLSLDDRKLRVAMIPEAAIRAKRANADASGTPLYAAIRPTGFSGAEEQTWELLFYPTPDNTYTISYAYGVNPAVAALTTLQPLGSKTHGETILASCLACAELYKDRARGVHYSNFQDRLSASVARDRRMSGQFVPEAA